MRQTEQLLHPKDLGLWLCMRGYGTSSLITHRPSPMVFSDSLHFTSTVTSQNLYIFDHKRKISLLNPFEGKHLYFFFIFLLLTMPPDHIRFFNYYGEPYARHERTFVRSITQSIFLKFILFVTTPSKTSPVIDHNLTHVPSIHPPLISSIHSVLPAVLPALL